MLSIHFNGHSQHHPEASGRPLRDQLEEALGALGFTRMFNHPGVGAAPVSALSADNPEPEAEKLTPQKEAENIHARNVRDRETLAHLTRLEADQQADTPDPAQNVAPETAEPPKPRRGRPPKAAEPVINDVREQSRPAPGADHALQAEPAPQISTSPEDRKLPEEPATLLTHDDVRQAIGAYGKAFGDEVAVKHGRTFMGLRPGQKIPEIPAERIEAVVAALRSATASGKAEPASAVDELG